MYTQMETAMLGFDVATQLLKITFLILYLDVAHQNRSWNLICFWSYHATTCTKGWTEGVCNFTPLLCDVEQNCRMKPEEAGQDGEERQREILTVDKYKLEDQRRWRWSYLISCPLTCDWPAMVSMMASCEYMLMGVLYWAWMMVALPPGPFTSMGLWVESFSMLGLKPVLMVVKEEGKQWGRGRRNGWWDILRWEEEVMGLKKKQAGRSCSQQTHHRPGPFRVCSQAENNSRKTKQIELGLNIYFLKPN